MRVAFDAQCFHSTGDSRTRGIGRYSQKLVDEFSQTAQDQSVSILINGEDGSGMSGRPNLRHLSIPFLYPLHQEFNRSLLGFSYEIGEYDILHVLSPIEPQHVAVSSRGLVPWGTKLVVTLYDLIPLVYHQHYLSDPVTRRQYLEAIEIYHEADHIVSISHASKNDAVKLMGISPDKITVLPPIRSPLAEQVAQPTVWDRAKEKYLLYTGGDDFRKNIDGLVRAVSIVKNGGIDDILVKIACKVSTDTRHRIEKMALDLGVENNVVMLGYVPDEDLISLYRAAYGVIFPSHYEGLGMPVIEAMSYGQPILCGDNSSMPELVGNCGLYFNSSIPSDIAGAIETLWVDQHLRNEYAERSARRYSEIPFDLMGETLLSVYKRQISSESRPRRSVAIASPWPPSKSGIADYSERLSNALAEYVNVTKIGPENSLCEVMDIVRSAHALILHMGNSEFHDFLWEYLIGNVEQTYILVLHDLYLAGYWYHNSVVTRQDPNRYISELAYCEGESGEEYGSKVIQGIQSFSPTDYMMNKRALDHASMVIVHSKWARAKLEQSHPWVHVVPFPHRLVERRQTFVSGSSSILIGAFGHVASSKLPFEIIESIGQLRRHGYDVKLIFIGELSGSIERSILETINKLALQEHVTVTGYVSDEELVEWLSKIHISVNLRFPYQGESSASLADVLGAGIPSIVTDVGSFGEIPSDVVLKVPYRAAVHIELYSILASLIDDLSTMQRLGRNAKDYARKNSWKVQTDRYLVLIWMDITRGSAYNAFSSMCTTDKQIRSFARCWMNTIETARPWETCSKS